jgi:hypothetical protein
MIKHTPPMQLPSFELASFPPPYCISIPLSHIFGSPCPRFDIVFYTPIDIDINRSLLSL